MSDTMSFAELDGLPVELLPARTVLSMFGAQDTGGTTPGGLAPDQLARTALSFFGIASTSPGTDGSHDSGSNGASNG
ncbi:MAG: hypothetical protein ACRDSO_06855 [Pseudonocardiaceae bacterium]